MASCRCGGKTIQVKKGAAKKVAPKKVAAKKVAAGSGGKSAASKKATRVATRQANKGNPYAKGCKCSK